MGRLFDAGEERKKVDAQRHRNEGVLARATAVEEVLKEHEELDEASRRLGAQLAQAQAVQPIRYKEFRQPGSRWMIEHAQAGDDYIFQLFPLKPTKYNWKDVITQMIGAMDVIFPRSVQIQYSPPTDRYKIAVKFYTIRVEGVVKIPGWGQSILERALRGLSAVEAW